MDKEMFNNISNKLRVDILEMVTNAGSGHPGGSLSVIDILTYLYFEKMDIKDKNIEERDRLILSKGHAAPALYAVLCEKGYFDKEELKNLRKLGSILQGHPDSKKCPGVEVSTGSLGQGFSNACGMALGLKMNNINNNVYAILGDGELQEGIVWETIMAGYKFKLDNLIAVVDNNKIQLDGRVCEIMPIKNLKSAVESFGWEVYECDGHSFEDLSKAFNLVDNKNGLPKMIIANTVKGKGVSFMEDKVEWHGVAPSKEQLEQAKKEILG